MNPSFKKFNQSKQRLPNECLEDIENNNIEGEIKEALVKICVNQSIFRDKLLNKYSTCCLCRLFLLL